MQQGILFNLCTVVNGTPSLNKMCDVVWCDCQKCKKRNCCERENCESCRVLSEDYGRDKLHEITGSRDDGDTSPFEEILGLTVSPSKQLNETTTGNSKLLIGEEAWLKSVFRSSCRKSGNADETPERNSISAWQTNDVDARGHCEEVEKTKDTKVSLKTRANSNNQRKFSFRDLTVLPPLSEQKYAERSFRVSPAVLYTGRNSTSDVSKRKGLEIPRIIVSKANDEDNSPNHFNLPKISAADISNSRHLQAVSSCTPHLNRLAPPSLLEPYKAHRPIVQTYSQEKKSDTSGGDLRLPQLQKRGNKDCSF